MKLGTFDMSHWSRDESRENETQLFKLASQQYFVVTHQVNTQRVIRNLYTYHDNWGKLLFACDL